MKTEHELTLVTGSLSGITSGNPPGTETCPRCGGDGYAPSSDGAPCLKCRSKGHVPKEG